ncbi:MAG: CIA30 family protein [Rubrivivax sp.]|jgi:hypothetical protein|nr:CIA30 family protein [Rubrivivax sp.]
MAVRSETDRPGDGRCAIGLEPRDWRFFTDAVMGGLSTGGMSAGEHDGRPALCLQGRVRTENQGGFVQIAREVSPPPGSGWHGLEVVVQGNGRRYGVHLRTSALSRPWQSYRAAFDTDGRWQTVVLPFTGFVPYRTDEPFELARLVRIGIVAIGEPMDAALCVAGLAFVR